MSLLRVLEDGLTGFVFGGILGGAGDRIFSYGGKMAAGIAAGVALKSMFDGVVERAKREARGTDYIDSGDVGAARFGLDIFAPSLLAVAGSQAIAGNRPLFEALSDGGNIGVALITSVLAGLVYKTIKNNSTYGGR